LARLSWAARLYVIGVVAAAGVVIARGPFAFSGNSWRDIAILGLLLVVSESTATRLSPGNLSWSANTTATLAAAVLVGPVGAALVGACTVFSLRRGPSPAQRAFNTGMIALTAYIAGRVFVAMHGHVGVLNVKSFPVIIGAFVVAALAHVVVNHGLLGGVLWLARNDQGATRTSYAGVNARLLLTDVGYGAFGLLIAALWTVVGPFAPLLVLIPLFVARWAVAQFAEQQRAYEATVGALCQAVETKDFYTRGHSDRVSRGSVMIAREIGMRGDRVEAIRYAGMLHDVGKLGVPTKVLQKKRRLRLIERKAKRKLNCEKENKIMKELKTIE